MTPTGEIRFATKLHTHTLPKFGQDVQPHGSEWKEATQRAGANPTARFETSDDIVDTDYCCSCPSAMVRTSSEMIRCRFELTRYEVCGSSVRWVVSFTNKMIEQI